MVRPERFELPTFWFVAKLVPVGGATQSKEVFENTENSLPPLASFC